MSTEPIFPSLIIVSVHIGYNYSNSTISIENGCLTIFCSWIGSVDMGLKKLCITSQYRLWQLTIYVIFIGVFIEERP